MSTPAPLQDGTPLPLPSIDFKSDMIATYILLLGASLFYMATLKVVWHIRCTDKRSAPFYGLFFSYGLVDVIHAFGLMWMCFEMQAIRGQIFTPVTYVASFLTCFCYLVNIIGNGVMAFNRLLATFTSYPTYFGGRKAYFWVLGTVILAFISSIPSAFRQRTYTFEAGQWTFLLSPAWIIFTQRMIIMGWMILYFITAPIFTFWAWYRIDNFINVADYHKSDKSLIYFNVAHMSFNFCVFLYEIFELFGSDNIVIQIIHRNFFGFLYTAIILNSVVLTVTTIRVRQGLSKLICRVVARSMGKVSSSQQTIQVFNVSGRY